MHQLLKECHFRSNQNSDRKTFAVFCIAFCNWIEIRMRNVMIDIETDGMDWWIRWFLLVKIVHFPMIDTNLQVDNVVEEPCKIISHCEYWKAGHYGLVVMQIKLAGKPLTNKYVLPNNQQS